MRLTKIEIEGFRGFAQRVSLDLDADAIILVGANGKGKTTVFDAILWVLAGYVPRLGGGDKELLSLYSQSGEIRVALDVRDAANRIALIRRFDGEKQHLTITTGDRELRGAQATAYLVEHFWPDAMQATDTSGTIAETLTRCIYLQQDLVREFIEADNDKERFATVSELIGVGRIGELQDTLEGSRKAWSQATNRIRKEAQEEQIAMATLQSRIAELSSEPGIDESVVSREWLDWWGQAEKHIPTSSGKVPFSSTEASTHLDSAIKQLSNTRRSIERRVFDLTELLNVSQSAPPKPEGDAAEVQSRLSDARAVATSARNELKQVEQNVASQRHLLVQKRESAEELRALAELALRHLESTCPVCTQEYDPQTARNHLAQLISSADGLIDREISTDKVHDKAKELEKAELLVAERSSVLSSHEMTERTFREWQDSVKSMIKDLRLEVDDESNVIRLCEKSIDECSILTQSIAEIVNAGEKLSVALARAGELARNSEYRKRMLEAQSRISRTNLDIEQRDKTSAVVTQMIDALRSASQKLVSNQLKKIEPLVQRVFTRIDPHPTLRVVRFLTSMVRGHGHLSTSIADPTLDVSSSNPEYVLSSSQLNALAVSVFLGLNLGLRHTPLDVVLLDDPLQSLDDINLLGLVDLLRRTKDRRQLILSTHDSTFGALLARKLRPSNPDQGTKVVNFESWSREGPTFSELEAPSDTARLRVVA